MKYLAIFVIAIALSGCGVLKVSPTPPGTDAGSDNSGPDASDSGEGL